MSNEIENIENEHPRQDQKENTVETNIPNVVDNSTSNQDVSIQKLVVVVDLYQG